MTLLSSLSISLFLSRPDGRSSLSAPSCSRLLGRGMPFGSGQKTRLTLCCCCSAHTIVRWRCSVSCAVADARGAVRRGPRQWRSNGLSRCSSWMAPTPVSAPVLLEPPFESPVKGDGGRPQPVPTCSSSRVSSRRYCSRLAIPSTFRLYPSLSAVPPRLS